MTAGSDTLGEHFYLIFLQAVTNEAVTVRKYEGVAVAGWSLLLAAASPRNAHPGGAGPACPREPAVSPAHRARPGRHRLTARRHHPASAVGVPATAVRGSHKRGSRARRAGLEDAVGAGAAVIRPVGIGLVWRWLVGCVVVAGCDFFGCHGQPGHGGWRARVDDVAQKLRHGVAGVIGEGAVEGEVGERAVTALPGGEGEQSSASGHGATL